MATVLANPQLADLAALYEDAELRMLSIIAKRLKAGAEAPDWAVSKLYELEMVKLEMRKDLAKWAPTAATRVKNLIKGAYTGGEAEALATLVKAKMPTATAPIVENKALTKLLSETTQSVLGVHSTVLRSVDDAYRSVVREASSGMLLGSDTRADAVQQALNRFADKGITGFVDKKGRNWEMRSYVEMAVGTASHRASTQGHLDKLQASGHDLVVVSDHKGECDPCRKWEGKVLSISGIFHEGSAGTVDEARSAGLEHPGCRHRYGIWIEGVSKPPTPQGKPADYEARTQQRGMERQIRAWKRRAAVGDPKAGPYIKAWQKKLREHVDKHGLKRRSDREQLLTGKAGVLKPATAPIPVKKTWEMPKKVSEAPKVEAPKVEAPKATAETIREKIVNAGLSKKTTSQLTKDLDLAVRGDADALARIRYSGFVGPEDFEELKKVSLHNRPGGPVPIESKFSPGDYKPLDVGEYVKQAEGYEGVKPADLLEYEGHNYSAINGGLRSGLKYDETITTTTGDQVSVASVVKKIDAEMSRGKFKTPEPITVYRGAFSEPLGEVGGYAVEAGYTSTTVLPKTALDFAGPRGWVTEIRIPPGVKYLPGKAAEQEMILPRNTMYRVLEKDSETKRVVLEIVMTK